MSQHRTKEPSTKQNPVFCRKRAKVLSNQLYFNITTETQSLVSFYHCVSRWACRLFAAEAPCLPITSTLGPRHVKVVSISCRIHLLHRTLTDSILLSLKPFDRTKKMKRSGRREAEGKMERWKGSEGTGSGRESKRRGKRESYLALCRPSASLALGKKLNTVFCFALGWVYCHV